MKKIRTQYGERVRVVTLNNKPSDAAQEFKNDTNIYWLLKRYGINSDLTTMADWNNLYNTVPGTSPDSFVFTDYDKEEDFQFYQDRILKIKNDFLALPSYIRQIFGHDVGAYHAFVADPANYDACVRMGIKPGNVPQILPEVDAPSVGGVEVPTEKVEEVKEG